MPVLDFGADIIRIYAPRLLFLPRYSFVSRPLTNKSKLFAGISSLLNQLDEISIPYGIVTNKPFDYAEPLINYFNELKNCKALVCPDHLQNSKPSPEGILLACKKIGVDPKESVYVGDHPNDLIQLHPILKMFLLKFYAYLIQHLC